MIATRENAFFGSIRRGGAFCAQRSVTWKIPNKITVLSYIRAPRKGDGASGAWPRRHFNLESAAMLLHISATT
ncbi:MAG: hypothetical protein WBA48_15510 [Xanthobacteraceae bacterium]